MPRLSPRIGPGFWTRIGILGLLLAVSLQACAAGVETAQRQVGIVSPTLSPILSPVSSTPTKQPTSPVVKIAKPSSTPSPTVTATEPYVPTLFPTSLEAFGMVYNADATLEIPPGGSISMLFWGSEIPVTPVESTPEFIPYPTSQGLANSGDELIQLGCQLDRWGYAACPQDNPLLRFGCDIIVDPGGVDYGLEPKIPLVAVCKKETEEHELAKIEGVYLVGCAFKYEIHYIFKLGAEYILVSKADELKDLFAPIDSPDEALSYAQMVTGLEAMYNFAFFPTLMYFHESIEGTHVTQTDGGFEMNLFNFEACSCEPFINTQINIQVDRPGTITWVDAVPVFMTTGWSCAD